MTYVIISNFYFIDCQYFIFLDDFNFNFYVTFVTLMTSKIEFVGKQ